MSDKASIKERWDDFLTSLKEDKKKRFVFIGLVSLFLITVVVLPFISEGKNPEQISKTTVPKFELDSAVVDKKTAYDELFKQRGSEDLLIEDTVQEAVVESPPKRSNEYVNNYYSVPHIQPVPERKDIKPEKDDVSREAENRIEEVPKSSGGWRVPGSNSSNMRSSYNKSSNTIYAVIANSDKVVKTGSYVKIRLAEDIEIDGVQVKRNTIITGIAQYTNERMKILVNSVMVGGVTKQVQWEVYEEDGNPGIAVPESILNDIMKDGTDDAVDEGSKIGAKTPFGSVNVNLKKKNQEVSFVLRDGHRVYLKER